MHLIRSSTHGLLIASLCLAMPAHGAPKDPKPRIEKSEVDKAVGKCVGAVVVGGLLGGLLGGKRNRGAGIVAGAAAGGVVCAILMQTAKRKDRIIAAQRQAAIRGSYTANYVDDEGQTHVLRAEAVDYQPTRQLRQVRYVNEQNASIVSPSLAGPPRRCRKVPMTDTVQGNSASIPDQLFCFNEVTNTMEPYSEATA